MVIWFICLAIKLIWHSKPKIAIDNTQKETFVLFMLSLLGHCGLEQLELSTNFFIHYIFNWSHEMWLRFDAACICSSWVLSIVPGRGCLSTWSTVNFLVQFKLRNVICNLWLIIFSERVKNSTWLKKSWKSRSQKKRNKNLRFQKIAKMSLEDTK